MFFCLVGVCWNRFISDSSSIEGIFTDYPFDTITSFLVLPFFFTSFNIKFIISLKYTLKEKFPGGTIHWLKINYLENQKIHVRRRKLKIVPKPQQDWFSDDFVRFHKPFPFHFLSSVHWSISFLQFN